MDSDIFKQDLRCIDDLVEEMNGNLSIKYSKDQNYWRGSINFDNTKYFFQINYISVYPMFPPLLYCFKDETYSEIWRDKLWIPHSYKDGHLCLFTSDSGESSWKEYYRIDQVIRNFLTLLKQTKENRIAPKHTSNVFKISDYARTGEVYINNDLFRSLLSGNNTECFYAFVEEQLPNYWGNDSEIPIISIFSENEPEFTLFRVKYKLISRFFSKSEYKALINALVEDSILKTQKFLNFCERNEIPINQMRF